MNQRSTCASFRVLIGRVLAPSAVLALACLVGSTLGFAQNAYITTEGTTSVIDTTTNTVIATIPDLGAFGVAVTPDGSAVYLSNPNANSVSVIDTATNTLIGPPIPVGSQPIGVAVTPDGSMVYVANSSDNTVSVVATATNTVIATIPVGDRPQGVAVTPDGSKVYVTDLGSQVVWVIATASNTVVARILNRVNGFGMAVRDGFVYVASGFPTGNIAVIATAINTVIARIPVGARLLGVAVTPDGKVYVANGGPFGNTVSVIDTGSDTVIATIPVGQGPFGVAVTPDGSKVYVANQIDNTVSVIDTASDTVSATIPVSSGGFAFAFGNFIGPAPAAQLTSGDHCDGLFTGSFDGNIRVSAGQNCVFVSPCEIEGRVTLDGGTFNLACTVTGNIIQRDGNLILRQKARVHGAVQISGASAFTFNPSAVIRGDLHIRNLAADLPQGTVCGIKVGRMLIKNNRSSVEIGGPNRETCPGNDITRDLQADNNSGELSIDYNHIGGDLQVNDNSGSTDVSGNTVGDDMRCRGNASVTHIALNMVRGKARGQCAAFP